MKSKVGKYSITKKIAVGGMGAIYKAKHPTLNRDVILKELTLKGNRAINERFKREAQFMIDFRDDHIVQVYDHFKEGRSYYIVMEYVDGVTLSKLIDKNRYLPNEIAILIFYEICRALKHAHERGVIHRDIKPDNVLISRDGVVKLTDFGIATSKDSEEQGLTRDMTLGTPAYMSPEQISDSKNVDKRADIYSLGVVLYEMVTGKCPFPGNFTPETINAIHRGKYIPPRKVNPKVTPVVQRIIKKAMHHKVKRRYRDLAYVLAILARQTKKCRDEDMVRDTLRAYIYENKHHTGKVKKGSKNGGYREPINFRRVVLVFALITGVIAAGLWYGYRRGIQYELYKTNEYGALQVEVKVSHKGKDGGPRYIQGKILRKIKNRYKALADKEIYFFLDRDKSGKDNSLYRTRRLYFPTAEYRIYIDVDATLYQRDIFLKPREIQKKEKSSTEALTVVIDHAGMRSVPLSISHIVYDADSGSDITTDSDFYIRYYRRWVPWGDFIKGDAASSFLLSGKRYYFKIQHEGYYTKYMSIAVEPHQARLRVRTELQPLPGSLYVRSNIQGPEILINNASYYTHGGKNRRIKKLKALTKKYQGLFLSPGMYYITAKYDTITKTDSVEVVSGKSRRIIVSYSKSKNTLSLNVY